MDINPEALAQIPGPRRPGPWNTLCLREVINTRKCTVLVCKRWYRIGIRALWSHLVIWRKRYVVDSQPLIPTKVIDSCQRNRSLLPFITSLTIQNDDEVPRDSDIAQSGDDHSFEFLHRLENLRSIHCDISLLNRLDKASPSTTVQHIYLSSLESFSDSVFPVSIWQRVTYLEIRRCSGSLLEHFAGVDLSSLLSLRIHCDYLVKALRSIGHCIFPRLQHLSIQMNSTYPGFPQSWGVDLPRCDALRILEIIQVSVLPEHVIPIPLEGVMNLPLLHTLRLSIPTATAFASFRCPNLQHIGFIPPSGFNMSQSRNILYEAINGAIDSFPSISVITVYYEQLSDCSVLGKLLSDNSAPNERELELWASKGVSVLFDPPLLPPEHLDNRLIRAAQELVDDGRWEIIMFGEESVENSLDAPQWRVQCELKNSELVGIGCHSSRAVARNIAVENLIATIQAKI